MKAKYLFISLALVSVLCACTRDEESLFDKSASERAQEALENAHDVLIAPANGWAMLYFANLESRGYNVLVTFEGNGRVIGTAKNALTTSNKIVTDSSSTWQVALDYGPILTFDTYNEVLHAWADPRSDGDGYLGDYEFLILHAEANYVKLKGKKHSSYCYLYPLGAGKTAEQYFAEIEAAQSRFTGNNNLLHAQIGGSEYLLFDGSKGIFNLTLPGEKPDNENLDSYPFATFEQGLQLTVPLLASKGTKFDYKDGALVSEDAKIYALPAVDYFDEYMVMASGSWYIDFKNGCDSIKTIIAAIDEKLKATYPKNKAKASVNTLRLQKNSNGLILVFNYYGSSKTATVSVNYRFEATNDNGNLKLTYIEPVDQNAQKAINAFPAIETLLNTLSATYTPVAAEPINPSNGIRLTNTSNSELWYSIAAKL